ncbi:hypothetical protein J2Z83_000978 [Virgibacillus natechei]|uniref:Sporulation membrane protein YtrI C-terminal domain-containing protein n=1 Tax=Virgibacillus natechei TaxID=1216297 RepID=A0ABS4ID63_9BACI|nr:sporulation membrane protein YtrI [Virgibacillus natechei]MBP1968884.1 hypothetical protein [Virgibacillus natechei]UZD11678.1 hypothetical protein OLD84_12015 [Virgibacillus natechei]
MHIPPYHKKVTWQRFFIGAVFGALISYGIYIYIYGSLYERVLEENFELQSELTDVKNQNEALLQDKEDLDEQSKEPQTVESIEVTITSEDALRLDRLIIHQLEDLIKEEINHLIGQEISTVVESNQLLLSTIENKGFTVDDVTYHFDVNLLVISNNVKLTVETKLTDE